MNLLFDGLRPLLEDEDVEQVVLAVSEGVVDTCVLEHGHKLGVVLAVYSLLHSVLLEVMV